MINHWREVGSQKFRCPTHSHHIKLVLYPMKYSYFVSPSSMIHRLNPSLLGLQHPILRDKSQPYQTNFSLYCLLWVTITYIYISSDLLYPNYVPMSHSTLVSPCKFSGTSDLSRRSYLEWMWSTASRISRMIRLHSRSGTSLGNMAKPKSRPWNKGGIQRNKKTLGSWKFQVRILTAASHRRIT